MPLAAKRAMMSVEGECTSGSSPSGFATLESGRPTSVFTRGPSGQVVMATEAANWIKSAAPTEESIAWYFWVIARSLAPMTVMFLFSPLWSSSGAKIMEPSQPPGEVRFQEPQSWKARRMAARASSLQRESVVFRNRVCSSDAIVVQTAGHAVAF